MTRLCFQVSAFVVTAVFAIVIADVRRKPGMTPILGVPWLALQKAVAVAAIGIFCFIVARQLGAPSELDWCGVAASLLGTLVAARGKLDLADSHAWAGYFRRDVSLVRHGIYRLIRNPIYAGIFLYIAGAWMTMIRHGALTLALVNSVLTIYLVAFLLVSARREHALLLELFGEEYERYASAVPAFVPSTPRRQR